jgi:hypothetical protein
VAKAKSYSERMFIVERLGNLTAPEDRLALTEPAEKAARMFDEAVVAAVLRDTAGYPFFIQMYGDALWKGAAASVIGVEDLRRLRPRILHALDRGFFEARYARGSTRERELLRLIASWAQPTRDAYPMASMAGIPSLGCPHDSELEKVVGGQWSGGRDTI